MIEEVLRKKAKVVDEAIAKYLPVSHPDEMYISMRHLLDAGGKRLRPTALILAAEATGGKMENVLPAAVAVEMVHNFTLIHDDIMDQAELRRGLVTVHKKWGMPSAIIAGDALYSKAFEILAESKSEPARVVESIGLVAKTCTGICEGQWMDIDFETRDDVVEDEYLEMVEKKTAVLFAGALKTGAILSGAGKKEAQALWDFGILTGVGFQIYDDVIDLITPEEILGKAQGGDIMEGKRTLIIINAISKGVTIDVLGKSNATKAEVSEAISTLKKSGSIDYAMDKAVGFVEKGKSALSVLPDSEAKSLLLELADYMIERKY
ncbi:MAG: polyprenyl synthetase family protein [Candidatus Methanoperedens sp.]|jgi:geranylgeranyl diphosphate synthase type I|nr:polyprenyl synthetase family protein [Candidatus Methanoperedens sp.]PKL54138.1 MAG: phosphoesterase [Candidatus Methanoperedenaceae archaeon HGW-Methanoperedenaceae-1]